MRASIFTDDQGRSVLEIGKDPRNQGCSIFVMIDEMQVFRGNGASLKNKSVILPFDMREWPVDVQQAWIHGHAHLLEEYIYENLPETVSGRTLERWAKLRSLTIREFTEVWRNRLSTSGLSAPMAKVRSKKFQLKMGPKQRTQQPVAPDEEFVSYDESLQSTE